MFGNLLNNSLIEELVNNNSIKICPTFDINKLQIAQYPLKPLQFLDVENSEIIHDFRENKDDFILMPKTYYLVNILEQIVLPKGIVGRFLLSSTIIEKGLLLNAGKLEYPFGQKNERIRFGLYNSTNNIVTITDKDRIAYIEFFDLRGLNNKDYLLNDIDKNIYSIRLSKDADGPNYEKDNF